VCSARMLFWDDGFVRGGLIASTALEKDLVKVAEIVWMLLVLCGPQRNPVASRWMCDIVGKTSLFAC